MEHNRHQENSPSQHSVQVHTHIYCCPCSNVVLPYCPPGYRSPVLLQPPPLLRSPYLQHYQCTQLQLNPSSLPPSLNQQLPLSMNQQAQQITGEIAFEPPPRDRRNLEKSERDENKILTTQYAPVSENASLIALEAFLNVFRKLSANQVASLTTENYIKYLDNGCFIGETIARRNEQRPCFKNIQNLCNRTRTEVNKQNITVSNIHSQGVPWATKDFIFAFVRAINCWCILRGYLGTKDGGLGKIERELSTEFRECYANWEKCTKQLTHYLIQTFYKLDEVNSSTSLSHFIQSTLLPSSARSKYSPSVSEQQQQRKFLVETQTQTEQKPRGFGSIKKIPGILHIPSTSTEQVGIFTSTPDSVEMSPRAKASNNEGYIYMKHGRYSVPTKNENNSLLGTKTPIKTRSAPTCSCTSDYTQTNSPDDQIWKTAQSITPAFIKHHEESSFNNSVKKIYDMSMMQQANQIETWLNNELSMFDYVSHKGKKGHPVYAENKWQNASVTEECEAARGSDCDVTPRGIRTAPIGKEFSMYRKNNWEFKNGGLTSAAQELFENIFEEIENNDFAKNLSFALAIHLDDLLTVPLDLCAIAKKLRNKMYSYINEVVHDFRHFICYAYEIFSHDRYVLSQVNAVQDVFERKLKKSFLGADFGHITGGIGDVVGPLIIKERGKSKRSTVGDGDH